MADRLAILLVEDNPADARLIQEALHDALGEPFTVVAAGRLAPALQEVAQRRFDIIVVDLSLPDSQGIETFTRVQAAAGTTPVVVLTGRDDEELALRAVHAGAQDYLVKGQAAPGPLARALKYAIERQRLLEELRELDRIKSELLSTTTHELRTPLAVILGYAELLRRPEASADAVLVDQFADAIERHARRLHHLVEQLLAAARFTSHEGELRQEELDLAAVVGEVAQSLGAPSDRLRVELDDGRVTASADRAVTTGILASLLDNALKYSGAEGVCTVGVTVDETGLTGWMADEGIGMTEAELAKAFEPFWQADSSDTRQYGGVGLGLYVAHLLATSAGGWIRAESEPGRGSRFTFFLPHLPA